MQNVRTLLQMIILAILLTLTTSAQDTTTVETTSGNGFAPAGVIIQTGDYIKWVNSAQGLHNVIADDGSFDSGEPSSDRWEYVVQFNTTGFYNYYCEVHGGPNATGMSGFVQVEEPTSVNDQSKKYDFRLERNYPNPFNPTTSINFVVPQTSEIKLTIFDLLGKEITKLVDDVKVPGEYSVTWTAQNYTSGIYIYKLEANTLEQNISFVQTKKMVLIK